MTHLHPRTWLAALCLMFLAGCAQLGLEKAQNLDDRIQYGRAGVSAAYRTVGDLVGARTISAKQGASAFTKLEAVEQQLALAETLLKGGKPTDALSTVNLALAALTAIRAELAKGV